MQYFEWNVPNDGKFWRKLKEDAQHLHDIGVTSVWIPPAYKAIGQGDVGYGTYDLFDLGEFDQKATVRTKYGTKQELIDAIEELHKYQISVYLDAVMNHKAGADYKEKFKVRKVDPNQREKVVSGEFEIEGWTGFNFPGRNKKYSDFEWHWYHFSGTDCNATTGETGVYQIVGEGKAWAEGVDSENGNYDYLMFSDIDFDHPEVVSEMNRWGRWVANELNLDGMRLDAIKHINDKFIEGFLQTVRSDRGENFYAVGEYWKKDIGALNEYLSSVKYSVDLFDVPLHFNFFQASLSNRDFDLGGILNGTLLNEHPDLTVTFVDNHDSQWGSSLESQVKSWFKPLAYGLILLTEKGYPCVFYGDYYGLNGMVSPHRWILDVLMEARRKYAYGKQNYYFDHKNTVGFTREGDDIRENSGLAFLMSNGENGSKKMYVGQQHKGEVWHEITGNNTEEITIGEDGNAEFLVHGGKLAVWVKKES